MSLYGLSEDLEKDFKKLVEKYNKQYPDFDIDPDVHGPAELRVGIGMEYSKQTQNTMDFQETSVKSPLRKRAGILNLNLLNKDTFAHFG